MRAPPAGRLSRREEGSRVNAGIESQRWDVIVVGTGMGGATAGHALARHGLKVLFIEKGRSPGAPAAILGGYPEDEVGSPFPPTPERLDGLRRGGREWERIVDAGKPRRTSHIPFIGSGVGGSSALYGMAMERFFPADFAPAECFPEGASESTLPQRWPIAYEDLLPYYAHAEALYRVRGSPDPLRGAGFSPAYLDPAPLSPCADELACWLRAAGMHPYRLPLACEFVPECACCQSYLCARGCKNDAGRICVEPAVREHGASLLDACEVVRLEASAQRVEGVVCRREGRCFTLRARTVVLAAGALHTPRLLLASASAEWPRGLANRSGLVGRNLMRHYVDLYVIRPPTAPGAQAAWKEIAFNDFYHEAGGGKLGSVQDFGALPPVDHVLDVLADDIAQGYGALAGLLFRPLRPLIGRYLGHRLAGSRILAALMEDLPYADNRVELGVDGGIELHYRLHAAERRRIARMRGRMKALLEPFRPMLIKQAESNERLAHACGTCRFGEDARTSVLDPCNRAHDVDNLYVVDASFFPSSAGINPSLTIAANALRVVDAIGRAMAQGSALP
ncbi:GMC family oxidoreductase [Thauera sp. UPWRP]|nr:GMC family oxidoreductase [Thauera sp. UPWRP]